MRSCAALLFLVLYPLGVGAEDPSPPSGWKEVAGGYKKQAYKVWLPSAGMFDDTETSLVSPEFGQIRIFRSVCERKDGSLFAAGQIIMPPKLLKAKPKVRQDFFRDAFLREFDAKLTGTKNIKLGTMAGKEYMAKTPKGMARFRLFGTGSQMFRVAFVGTKAQLESKEVNAFFDSFKRTPQKKDK
jgi:hypothetical protein